MWSQQRNKGTSAHHYEGSPPPATYPSCLLQSQRGVAAAKDGKNSLKKSSTKYKIIHFKASGTYTIKNALLF